MNKLYVTVLITLSVISVSIIPDAAANKKSIDGQVHPASELIEALKTYDTDMHRSAINVLGKDAIPQLIKALDNKNANLRKNAAWELGQIRDKRALHPLIRSLKDENNEVRRKAVLALGEIGDIEAFNELAEALKDRDINVREEVATVLGQLGGKRAIPIILEGLKDDAEGVRASAATSLGKLGDKEVLSDLLNTCHDDSSMVRAAVIGALGELKDKKALPYLTQALKDEDAAVRRNAAWALGQFEEKETSSALASLLKDDDAEVRREVACSLGRIGDKKIVPQLSEMLKDKDALVRGEVAVALGKLGDVSALPFLLKSLKDEDTWVRNKVVSGLGYIKHRDAVPELLQVLRDKDLNPQRPYLIQLTEDIISEKDMNKFINEHGYQKALMLLVDVLEDTDRDMHKSAVWALGRIGDERSVATLISFAVSNQYTDTRVIAVWALGRTLYKPQLRKRIVPALITALEDKNIVVRFSASVVLSELYLRDRRVVPALLVALNDEHVILRRSVTHMLRYPIYKETIPMLITLLNDQDADVRNNAAYALGRRMNKAAVPALTNLLKDHNREVRRTAILSLEKIGDKTTIPALLELLKDKDAGIRISAAIALSKLGDEDVAAPILKSLLRKNELWSSENATNELMEFGDERALPFVKRVISEFDIETKKNAQLMMLHEDAKIMKVRMNFIAAFGSIGAKGSVQHLVKALKDKDADIRLAATLALGKIGTQEAVVALLGVLKDTDANIRRNATVVLSELEDKRAIKPLIDVLKDKREDYEVRSAAVDALVKIGGKETLPVLLEALSDSEVKVRNSAAYAVIGLIDEKAKPILVSIINDGHYPIYIRQRSMEKLREIAGMQALPILLPALKDQNKDIRISAVTNLEHINPNDPAITSALLGALRDKDKGVRLAALEALAKSKDKRVVPALIRMLKDTNAEILVAAVSALREHGVDTNPYLPAKKLMKRILYQNDVESGILPEPYQLKKIKSKEVISELLAALKVENEEVRAYAASALGALGDRVAVPSLIMALKDQDDVVRNNATRALGQIADKKAGPALVKILKERDQDTDLIISAIDALGEMKYKEGVEAISIHTAAVDIDEHVCISVYRSLRQIGGTLAVQGLVAALDSEEEYVSKGAAKTLGQIEKDRLAASSTDDGRINSQEMKISSSKALLENKVIFPIYKALELKGSADYFNLLRNELLFDSMGIEMLKKSSSALAKAMGYYLDALRERESGNFQEQIKKANKALQQIEPEANTALAILSLWLRLSAELKLNLYQEARNTALDAQRLTQYLSIGEENEYAELFKARTQYYLGEICASLGDIELAINAYSESLNILKNKDYPSRVEEGGPMVIGGTYQLYRLDSEVAKKLEYAILTGLGESRIRQGMENLNRAVELGKAFKINSSDDADIMERCYLGLIKQYIADSRYEEAQKCFEELNLRRTDYKNKSIVIRLDNIEKQKYIDEYRAKKNELETLSLKIEQLQISKDEHRRIIEPNREVTSELKVREKELANKKRALSLFLKNLSQTHPDLGALLGATPINLATIQKKLPPHVQLIQYVVLPEKIVIFLINNNGVDVIEKKIGKADVEKMISDYLSVIAPKNPNVHDLIYAEQKLKNTSMALYDLLIKPVENQIDSAKTLGIVPFGILHYVPFGALPSKREGNSNKYLIDRYNIFYINSTTILAVALEKAGNTRSLSSMLAFLNPSNVPDIDIDTHNEIDKIKFARKRVYRHAAATKKRLQAEAKDFAVIHFSTHGWLDPRDNTKSYLEMADGRLTVSDIWGLPLSDVRLVTLSSCETALGKERMLGDEIISMENAFTNAGSPSVISTLWKVNSEASSELMIKFYAKLKKGSGKAEALRMAQRMMIKDRKFSHPYFWAGFVLRGAWQ